MRIKKKVLRKIISVFASVLLLVNAFAPYLLITPSFVSPVKAQVETVMPTAEPTPTSEVAPTETVTPEPTQTPVPTVEVIPTETPVPTSEPTPTVTPNPTVTPEPTPIQTPSPWTFEKVELNKEYIAPQNNQVKLTFTKLPNPAGNIKIEEITLTKEQIKQTGSLSDKAYDITSDMKDGDFTYNLSLPIPESSKGKEVSVKFAEELVNIDSAAKVENTLTKTDTSVSVASLDHFTIFIVVSNPTNATYYDTVVKAATHLLSQQNSDGGWQYNGGSSSNENHFGIVAVGLLNAYQLTHKAEYLTGATVTADHLVAKEIPADAATDNTSGHKFYSGDIKFLAEMAQVTGNTAYSDKAGALMTHFISEPNRYCATGCTTAQIIADAAPYHGTYSAPNTGPADWQLSDWVEAAKLTGQTTWGTDLANIIKADVLSVTYVPTLHYYIHGLGAALKATSLFSVENAGISTKLIAEQNVTTGAMNAYADDGVDQATAYSILGFSAAGDSSHATTGAHFFTGNQNSNGGWTESDGTEDTEYNSEIIQAIFTVLPSNTFYNIQDAINAASPGDTINIAAGTYDLGANIITIDKSLTIAGPNAAISPNGGSRVAEAIIQGDDATNQATFRITSASATVAFKGLEFQMAGPEIRSDVPGATITLQKNIFTGTKDHDGMYFNDPNLTVDDNLFTNEANLSTDTIQMNASLPTVGTISITNNTWSNIAGPALNLDNLSGTISNNHFDNVANYGVLLAGTPNVTISNNVFNNISNPDPIGVPTWGAGVRFYNTITTSASATITGNTFSNSFLGIGIKPGADITGAPITVHENTFTNNNLSGGVQNVLNAGTGTLDATNNWWESACPDFDTIISGSTTHNTWYIDAGRTTLNSTLSTIFTTVSSTLASQGVASNIGDATACNYASFPNLYFEKSISGTKMGKITFSSPLDLSSSATQTFLQALGSKMEQSNGRIAFDARTSAEFAAHGASLVMYDLTPGLTLGKLIVRDDTNTILNAADVVTGFIQDSETHNVTFNAAHFTQFDIDTTAPTKPVATPGAGDYTSDQSVTLSSTDALSGVDKIYYTTDGTAPNNTKTEYTTKITIDKDMTIKAIAYDKAGNASEILTATYAIAPKISVETSSSVTSSSTTITWTTDNLATSRVIYDTVSHPVANKTFDVPLDKYGYANTTNEFNTSPNEITSHSVGLSGLTSGTTYYYRTVSHGSPEAVSAEKTFTTSSTTTTSSGGGGTGTSMPTAPVCNDQKPGNAPVLLSAVAGFNSVTLTWAKANDPVSYYLVTFGTKSGEQLYGNPNVGNKDTTSYTVSGLSGRRTYYFKVRAGNGCMPGDYSNELSGSPTGGFVAGVPGGFAAGVLGAQTQVTPTVAPSGQVSPSLVPNVKNPTGTPPQLNYFQRIWKFILHIFGK